MARAPKAADEAHRQIRALIAAGDLAPGAPLREEELAARCGVSRTPVREALMRLEREYLVRRTDGQRSYVADWSMDDIAEMFALRSMLEGHAAARAATRVDAAALERLRSLNAQLGEAVSRNDTEGFLAANRAFHDTVLGAAQSPRLVAMIGGLVEQPVVRRTAVRYGAHELGQSHAEHAALIEAFARRDAGWAESVMTGHIRRAYHAFADASRSRD
jgi:DNA-binding GntR family transcriptional regulator